MDKEEIKKRIISYINRVSPEHSWYGFYPLGQEGIFSIVGAEESLYKDGKRCNRKFLGNVRGRYIDAIEIAVQKPEFYVDKERIVPEQKHLKNENFDVNPGHHMAGIVRLICKEFTEIPKNLDLDNLVNGLGPFSKGYFL